MGGENRGGHYFAVRLALYWADGIIQALSYGWLFFGGSEHENI